MNVSRLLCLLTLAHSGLVLAQVPALPYPPGETTLRLSRRVQPLETEATPPASSGRTSGELASGESRSLVGRSDGAADLATIRKLKISNLHLTDSPQGSPTEVKGLVGAEVEEVFPNAVSRQGGFVANINSPALSLTVNEGLERARMMVGHPHGLNPGDRVRLLLGNQTLERDVTAVPTGLEFEVGGWTFPVQPVFVYGRFVQDKTSVDSGQILATAVSAVQELARQTENLQEQVEILKAQNADLLRRLEALEPKPSSTAK